MATDNREILQNNHIPTPPTPEGNWADKGRDHNFFQEIVSNEAIMGGVHAGAGCPHTPAKTARQTAVTKYYKGQEKVSKEINR